MCHISDIVHCLVIALFRGPIRVSSHLPFPPEDGDIHFSTHCGFFYSEMMASVHKCRSHLL